MKQSPSEEHEIIICDLTGKKCWIEIVNCKCPCHTTRGMMHIVPCCNNGKTEIRHYIESPSEEGKETEADLKKQIEEMILRRNKKSPLLYPNLIDAIYDFIIKDRESRLQELEKSENQLKEAFEAGKELIEHEWHMQEFHGIDCNCKPPEYNSFEDWRKVCSNG